MNEAGAMHGRQGVGQLDTNLDYAVRIERSSLPQFVFERIAVDEFHPDADVAVDPLGAVNRDDVLMTHSSEQTSLLDDGRLGDFIDRFVPAQDLERNLSIEPRVPGPVHIAERSAPDLTDELQRTPFIER